MANSNESPYKGSAQITREQFLFYEMRTTARLMREGLEDNEVIDRIVEENLFQYPTEKSIRQMAKACIARLKGMGDEDLIEAVVSQSSETAKQICMYAMMKQYRLVWDFMITVIGEKYRMQNFSFSQMDVNVFFMQLQEQDDYVAGWSESTVKKIRQILDMDESLAMRANLFAAVRTAEVLRALQMTQVSVLHPKKQERKNGKLEFE